MTTKRRRGRAAAKKKKPTVLVTYTGADGITTRVPAGEVVGRYIETLQRDAEATGNRGPLDAYYAKLADALGKRVLAQPGRVRGGNERAKEKLRRRKARVARIRERFDPQPDRAACEDLRVEVEVLLIGEGHIPPKNATRSIDEIVEALVT